VWKKWEVRLHDERCHVYQPRVSTTRLFNGDFVYLNDYGQKKKIIDKFRSFFKIL